ncbi:hypothetical protein FRC07_000521 [Ceratobasidium sp. 392]|nr:hypothetical protein FRC07_000521 [Ceratobasidium sp. 392]
MSRELNYVHHGWSPAAVATIAPWTASRIDCHQQVNESGHWVTKRTLVQQLALNIPPQDITSVLEFDADVRAALGRPTASEKFKVLEKVYQLWGDVVLTVFELGALLAISDTDPNFMQLSTSNTSFSLEDLSAYQTPQVNICGGDPSLTPDNIAAWLSRGVHPSGWAQARIVQVIPTTDLLQGNLKLELVALYSGLLSCCPSVIKGNSVEGHSFDGTAHALKPIKSIIVHSNRLVNSLTTQHCNGASSIQHGGPGGKEQVFCLCTDKE